MQQLISSVPNSSQYVVGYQWTDEPPCTENVPAEAATIRNEDPTRMSYAGQGTWVGLPQLAGGCGAATATNDNANLNATDITEGDSFAVTDPWDYFTCAPDCLWEYGQLADNGRADQSPVDSKPFFASVETGTDDLGLSSQNPGSGVPSHATLEQVNSAAWLALLHGASGINWFCDDTNAYDGCVSPTTLSNGLPGTVLASNLSYIDHTIGGLAPVLNSPWVSNGVQVSSSNPAVPISTMVKKYNGATYVFVEADRVGSTTGVFTLPGLTGAPVTEIYDSSAQYDPAASEQGKSFNLSSGGSFTDALPGNASNVADPSNYTVRIFEVNGSGTQPPSSSPLQVSTGSLPAGTVGASYSAPLSASGGTAPYTWNATGLPAGLSITGDQVTGVPTAQGTSSVNVTVSDSSNPPATATATLTLTVSGAPSGPGPPGTDLSVNATGGSTLTSPAVSTSLPAELLTAFVSANGPSNKTQSATVSGGGLTWKLVKRANSRPGTSEAWQATAASPVSAITVTSKEARPGYDQQLTVLGFPSSQVGSSAAASGTTGAPTVSLSAPSHSYVFGVGHDPASSVARTAAPNQSVVDQWVDPSEAQTAWVQAYDTATSASGSVALSDTAPTTDPWNLVGVSISDPVPAPPPNAGLSVDQKIWADGHGVTSTPAFSTSSPNELLVALTASDGPGSGGQQTTVSGAGLTWTLAARTDTQLGTAEIWTARAAQALSGVQVTSTQAFGGYDQSLVVRSFTGAGGTGAAAGASAPTGAPSLTLTPEATGSAVLLVGNDWDNAVARTLGPGQVMIHQRVDTGVGDTYWVQGSLSTTTAGTPVALGDTAPTTDQWNVSAVEVVPG